MLKHINLSEIFERWQSVCFAEEFGCTLEKLPQGPGITGDYLITETSVRTKPLEMKVGSLVGRRVEFKNDKKSLQYKSFYIEFEQTSDFWVTTKRSGHHKAVLAGDLLVINSGNDCYIFDEKEYFKLISYTLRVVSTKTGANGNQPGCYTKGKIVRLRRARQVCSHFYEMPPMNSQP